MRTDDFDYELPEELIAQRPADDRTGSRLLVLNRNSRKITHTFFSNLGDFLRDNDLLITNNSKVIPARIRGTRAHTGGNVEMLLIEELSPNDWWAMAKPGKRLTPGSVVAFYDLRGNTTPIRAEVLEKNESGHIRFAFSGCDDISRQLEDIGEIPLPPYIARKADSEFDAERYQTVYASRAGSVAAPTAGLHFTPPFIESLKARGISFQEVTLHVGYGTFAPVKVDDVSNHHMHSERYELPEETAEAIRGAREAGRRVLAVGTTTVRVLESVAERNDGQMVAGRGTTDIFIHPPRKFHAVDAMITNFHLPKSTLLMLISAFASPGSSEGIQTILDTYEKAVEKRYRFFSYGDAMLIE